MDGSNKNVGLDNVRDGKENPGDGEDKFDLDDVYNGVGDSNDNIGGDDVGGANSNDGDDANFGNGDSKFDCGDDSEWWWR